jgi:polyisoprenoid-binding protein YceI
MHDRIVGRVWTGRSLGAAGILAAAVTAGAAETSGTPRAVEVRGGNVVFDVGTNVPALGVHGKSGALQGQARLRQDGGRVVLEAIDAVVPVKSLGTGIGQRDEHMRKHIFTTADGQTPDLHFVADAVACPAPAGRESVCPVAGQLTVRGTARPFNLTLKVRPEGSGYRAAGDGMLKLSDWGIERPSQLGVKTDDEVKLHLEFTAAPATRTAREEAR